MKTRKILAIAIIAIMFLVAFVGTAKADTALAYDEIVVTSDDLTNGQTKPATLKTETVEYGKKLQLKAYHNNRTVTTKTDGTTTETNTIGNRVANATWTSSDTSVATVSSLGEVTGIKAGTVTISVTGDTAESGTIGRVTVTVTGSEAEDFTDLSNVTFNAEDTTTFNTVNLTFKNFTPKDQHVYSAYITQDPSYTYDGTSAVPSGCPTISYDKDKNTYYARFTGEEASFITEETKDAYLVIIEKNISKISYKMVLGPTKIEKPKVLANLGGGYLESFHVNTDHSTFYNSVNISKDRTVTYKLGEVTDYSILNSIANEESGAFSKLLAYAKADSNQLATGSFNFETGAYETANVARATGKIALSKYYYVYEVADTVNGKYLPVEDVVVFNGSTDGLLVHFAFAGTQSTDPYTTEGNTTVPTTTTGDNSIATKKIPQTGATPVFMIVLGSAILVAAVFVVANKKYRDIK